MFSRQGYDSTSKIHIFVLAAPPDMIPIDEKYTPVLAEVDEAQQKVTDCLTRLILLYFR